MECISVHQDSKSIDAKQAVGWPADSLLGFGYYPIPWRVFPERGWGGVSGIDTQVIISPVLDVEGPKVSLLALENRIKSEGV